MTIRTGVVDFSRMFSITPLTAASFGGSNPNNTMNLTNMAQVGTGFDFSATMDDKNGDSWLNSGDELFTTFPGDSAATALTRVPTNQISNAGSGFGAGADFSVWEAASGDMYILFSGNFDLTRISATGTLTLTEQGDAPGTMSVNDIICFADGTLIETPRGPRKIEDLRAGDLVSVAGSRPRPIRWISHTAVDVDSLRETPKLRPVVISRGALGDGLPTRDLRLSRQHRVVLRSSIVERMFGQKEIFAPAHQLLDIPGVYTEDTLAPVAYYHILLDTHEMLTAAGIHCESLHTGPQAMNAIKPELREEISRLVPDIPAQKLHAIGAKRASRQQLRNLICRSQSNNKPLFEKNLTG